MTRWWRCPMHASSRKFAPLGQVWVGQDIKKTQGTIATGCIHIDEQRHIANQRGRCTSCKSGAMVDHVESTETYILVTFSTLTILLHIFKLTLEVSAIESRLLYGCAVIAVRSLVFLRRCKSHIKRSKWWLRDTADDEECHRGSSHEDWRRSFVPPRRGELWTTERDEVEDVEVQNLQDKVDHTLTALNQEEHKTKSRIVSERHKAHKLAECFAAVVCPREQAECAKKTRRRRNIAAITEE